MNNFLEALTGDLPFIRNALIAGLIASASFGVVGTYVVARRISYIAASIAHSVLGGIGAAVYFQRTFDLPWLTPMVGALVAALFAAAIIGLVSLHADEREDTVIGAIWATGMASGLLFLHYAPPPAVDATSYFFADILIISNHQLVRLALLGALVVALGLYFYNRFVAICFDEEFARIRGVRVSAWYLLLLGLTAVSVVILVTLVGIILAIALLTLPAAIASRFSNRLWQMMLLSIAICAVLITSGLVLSFQVDSPSGPTIILLSALVYFTILGVDFLRSKKKIR
ncbi:MAG: metal ABC transporter permease [Verrucomicrobiales bacterium]